MGINDRFLALERQAASDRLEAGARVEASKGGLADGGAGSIAAQIAAAVAALVASAPSALNTLDELAAALADDANFATTVTNALALKATKANPAFTGTISFAGAAPVTLPLVITGSRGGNAVLASLLTAIASTGFITDSTTA